MPRNVTIEHELMKRRHASATPHSDLGRSARTLLVAAYLASHNLAAHDMRYFSTERTRRSGARGRGRGRGRGGPRGGRGRGRGVAVLDGASLAVCRVFPLERLLAIFCAIRVADDNSGQDMMDESVCMSFSTSCLVQISTLVSLNYLSKEGGGDGIAEPKYRCNVSQEQAFNIAKTLDITLQEYMDI